MNLHPVKRATKASNRFCGPAVLSILTGLDTADTARLLRKVSGKRSITGTHTSEMRAALHALGIDMLVVGDYENQRALDRPTLAQWAHANPQRGSVTYLLSVGRHWAVVQGRRYCCGLTKTIVPLKGCPKWRARVKAVWAISDTRARQCVLPIDKVIEVVAPKPVDRNRQLREQSKALAKAWGVTIEPERLSESWVWWVWPPKGTLVDEYGDPKDDPLEGQRCAAGWDEVLSKVRTYVDAIKASRVSTLSTAAMPSAILASS